MRWTEATHRAFTNGNHKGVARSTLPFVVLRKNTLLIAVLEDDPRRITAMRNATLDTDRYERKMFDSATELISWLESNLERVALFSLDRDLDSTAVHDDKCGNGEDVTAFLLAQSKRFPVIIHSSNALRAPAMHMELAMAGFESVYLRPFRDADQWAADVKTALDG